MEFNSMFKGLKFTLEQATKCPEGGKDNLLGFPQCLQANGPG